jgi:hypothetical protein
VSLHEGNVLGRNAFAVAVYPERSAEFRSAPKRCDIFVFVLLNLDLLIQPGYAFGSWFDRARSVHVLDVVVFVSDEQAALELGWKFLQTSIFHLATQREIRVRNVSAPIHSDNTGTPLTESPLRQITEVVTR